MQLWYGVDPPLRIDTLKAGFIPDSWFESEGLFSKTQDSFALLDTISGGLALLFITQDSLGTYVDSLDELRYGSAYGLIGNNFYF